MGGFASSGDIDTLQAGRCLGGAGTAHADIVLICWQTRPRIFVDAEG